MNNAHLFPHLRDSSDHKVLYVWIIQGIKVIDLGNGKGKDCPKGTSVTQRNLGQNIQLVAPDLEKSFILLFWVFLEFGPLE